MKHALPILCVLCTALSAQQLVHRSSMGGVPLTESDVETFLTPLPDLAANFGTPTAALPVLAYPCGDATMNNVTGVIYATNGAVISQTNDGRYGVLAPAAAVAPAPVGPLGGFVFGMALNPILGVLYLTSGAVIGTTPAAPPYVLAGAPVPFAFPILAPPMTGLDYDVLTGSLWACDAGGNVYNCTVGGLPIGVQPVLLGAGPPMATDLVVNRHVGNVPGTYVQFVGLGVINYATGALQPSAMLGIPPGTENGLAFHDHPGSLGGSCGCGGAVGPVNGVTSPSFVGNAGFGFTLTGAPPLTTVINAGDFFVAPSPFPGGCTLWLPFPPALLFFLTTDAFGNATQPIPLPAALALIGLTGYCQWAVPCAANPTGFTLSNALQMIIAAP